MYQNIPTGRSLLELGMDKLLHKHYLERDDDVKRHDGDHTITLLMVNLCTRLEIKWRSCGRGGGIPLR